MSLSRVRKRCWIMAPEMDVPTAEPRERNVVLHAVAIARVDRKRLKILIYRIIKKNNDY